MDFFVSFSLHIYVTYMPCKKTRRKKHQRMSGKWNMKRRIRLIIKSRKDKDDLFGEPWLGGRIA